MSTDIISKVEELYAHNGFMNHCGIHIIDIACGKARVGLKVIDGIHTNLNSKIHGGLLMTLMDNATGIAGASIGKRVVTMSMTTSFIKDADVGALIEAEAVITSILEDKITMAITVTDKGNDKLLAIGISTMLVIANFEGIPEKW